MASQVNLFYMEKLPTYILQTRKQMKYIVTYRKALEQVKMDSRVLKL